MNSTVIDTKNITRVEVIDDTGRAYSSWNNEAVELSVQDDGRTLKIFIYKNDKEDRTAL